jgi:competence protein ComEC
MKRRVFIGLIIGILILTLSCTTSTARYTYSVHQGEGWGGYTLPWEEHAQQVAQETETIRFYFMSGEGQSMGAGSNVKSGDSCLIAFPNGEVMLIDGGMANYAPTLKENLRLLGVTSIDYLVLSHMHNDHYGSFFTENGILATFDIGVLYWNGTYNMKQDVADYFDATIERYNPTLEILTEGDTLTIGDVHIEIFNPSAGQVGKSYGTEGLNNTSLAMQFDYRGFTALFSGDLYLAAEFDLIAKYGDRLASDLVKANHHGRNTSNTKPWTQVTKPRIVVATSGNIIDDVVYRDYASVGAMVFNDTIDGYVRVVSDGQHTHTTTSRARSIDTFDTYDEMARSVKR